jgi:hypothetical protein
LLTGALAAAVILSLAVGVAAAQAPATGSFTATIKKAKSGTKKKPKSVTAAFVNKVTTPNATAASIELTLGKGLAFSGKGFKRCKSADLLSSGPTACPSGSKAGPPGVSNARLGSGPSATPLTFDVSTFVQNDTSILIYLNAREIPLQSVITGKISSKGSKLTISIPFALRQPLAGVDASLVGLTQTFTGKAGKHYIVSSTGCTGKKWKLKAKITFAPRADGTPVPAPLQSSTTAPCKK